MGSYVSVLRRRIGVVVIIAVVLTPLLAWALTPDARYASTATVRTGETLAANAIGAYLPYEDPENRLATEVEVFGSAAVTERATTALHAAGWTESGGELAGLVSMTPRGLSALLDIRGTADTAERAEELTGAFLDAYLTERRAMQQAELEVVVAGLEAQRGEAQAALTALGDLTAATPDVAAEAAALQSRVQNLDARIQEAHLWASIDTTGVALVASASPGEAVAGLGTTLTLVLAAAAALLVGVGAVLLVDAWRNPVRTRREAQDLLGLPVVGELPRVAGRYRPEDALLDPQHPVTGAARGLRLRLTGLHGDVPRSVLVTSLPGDADDALHAATALAAAYGRAGLQVAFVVDPRAHGQRWATALRPHAPAAQVGASGLTAVPTTLHGVWVVPATGRDGSAGVLDLASPREALAELTEVFGLVVLVDVAENVPDAAGVGHLVDVTLVVVGLERTRAGRLEELRRTLEGVGVVVDGVVLAGRHRGATRSAGKEGARPAPAPVRAAGDGEVPARGRAADDTALLP